jgi:hypothetical protein
VSQRAQVSFTRASNPIFFFPLGRPVLRSVFVPSARLLPAPFLGSAQSVPSIDSIRSQPILLWSRSAAVEL